ncbi:hypothetical protein CGRA01v4_05878 [Colletotrichum graminicola]|uniref:Uncharacterized protein n=1 Tax=Colletotrichum graminicola (strain M1.001 / M2 / FGSC 10212) TaxID=645133 RepID=E3QNG5_COLGM|nr:uncharacterized protein GLRG_07722 [Colletotrichum graminicola M1.001]EFQ32452.1 hypothetical protein GLRG_07722 [Colletotrichum graminicola M1.001]WDK14597.1 hypothetical protein CGRA01v4_05878 [Colletotrichum graminicola]
MASPALPPAQANPYRSGLIGTHQPSPAHSEFTMQQQQQRQRYPSGPVPDPRNPGSYGNDPFAPVVASDLAQPSNRSSPLANNDEQKARRFAEDYAKFSAVLAECDPEAVRRAIRDNHEKCLLGSHYHTAFLMNVTMHIADQGILHRAVRDFGSRIVPAAKHDLVDLMSQSDLDEVADAIISKASNTFLDKALVARLPTIEARRLVNALARAERLGYDANDIISDDHVIPFVPSNKSSVIVQPGPHHDLPGPHEQSVAQILPLMAPHPLESVDPSVPKCQTCQRGFPTPNAYAHHVKHRICTRPAPRPGPNGERYICPFCTQTLSVLGGLKYHLINKVCGDNGEIDKDSIVPTMPGTSLNPPAKPPASDTAPIYLSSVSNSPAAQHASTPPVAKQTPRAAPPSTQPDSSESLPLGTPRAKDMAHLTASQVHALKEELRLAEESFRIKINDTQRAGGDADEIQKRITSLRNSYACKQSTIRKKYNIRLRQRRGREEMEHERARMGIPEQLVHAVETPTRDVHADKRARINGNGDATITMATQDSRQGTPIKTVAVVEMGNGLNGSNATVATEDPTASASQGERSRPPSSSYQQNGYRVEVHVPSPSKKPNSASPVGGTPPPATSDGALTAEKLLQQMSGASAHGVDDDDSSSDDSSADSED